MSIPSVCPPSNIPGMHQLPDRRRLRTSPINSPSRQTCLPTYTRMKHARTFAEAVSIGDVSRSALINVEPLHTPSTRLSTVTSNLRYVIHVENVRLECITGFTVTRGVVENVIQHEARDHSLCAVSPIMHNKNAHYVCLL